MQRQYNLRNPAVKRLMKEAQELREPTEQYYAHPIEDNLFEWHFTIRGPADSEFEGGLYHGRIILPPEYPMKPPSIILLTPNGRFDINRKICLSISGYHPESWQPCWSIRTALLAIIGFMPTHGAGAIGSLDYSAQERKTLAKRSQGWNCQSCGDISHVLAEVTEASEETNKKAKELASQISFQTEKDKINSMSKAATSNDPARTQNSETASSSVSSLHPSVNGAPQAVALMPATSLYPMSPFRPVFNEPLWQPPVTNSAGSKFGPTFPLPFVSLDFPSRFSPQYFMPANPPFYNPEQTTPNVQAAPASSQLATSCSSSIQPNTSASNTPAMSVTSSTQSPTDLCSIQSAMTTQSPTAESTAQLPTTERMAKSPTTESTAQLPTTERTAKLPTTERMAMSQTTDRTANLPTTERMAESPTAEMMAKLPTTERTAQSPTTERTAKLSTTERTAQSPTYNSTTIQSAPNMSQSASSSEAKLTVRRRQTQNGQPESPREAVSVSSSPLQTREIRDKNVSLVVIVLLATSILLLVIRRLLMIE